MLAGLLQFLFAPGKDEFFLSFQLGQRGDITDGAVQSDLIIVGDEVVDNPAGIFKGEGRFGADTVSFNGFVPAFYLAVTLGVSGRDADVGHLAQADEVLEVAGDELGAVVRDDTRAGVRELFSGALEGDFYILFSHRFGYAHYRSAL